MAGVTIGTAWLQLAVSGENIASEIGKRFSQIESSASKTGKAIGSALASGSNQSFNLDAAEKELTSLQAAADKSGKGVEAALHRQSQASMTVTQKTKELADATAKYGQGSSQVVAKEKQLSDAKFKLSNASQQAVVAQKAHEQAMDRAAKAADNLEKETSQAGQKVGGAFAGVREKIAGALGGIGQRVGTELKKADGPAEAAGKSAGGFFSNALSTAAGLGLAKIGGSLVKGLTSPIRAGFKGGWARLTSIEEAKATMSTIFDGNTAKIEDSMARIGKAVDGTRFATSEAADMAAQLAAAGIEGDKLQRWLTLTTDSAQVSNKSFGDMQGVLQKVASTGKVTGETFDSFPLAASALSDSLGISQEEVRKLASEGKISADQLATALESRIGGAAQKSGATLGSMLANIQTAWSAAFADLMGPVRTALLPVAGIVLGAFKGLRDGITKPLGEALEGVLGPWGETLGKMFNPADVQKRVGDWSSGIVSGFQGISAILGSGEFKGPDMTFGLEEDSPIVGFLFTLRDGLQMAKDAVKGFIDGFGGMEVLTSAFSGLLPVLMGPLGILKSALGDVFAGGAVDAEGFGQTLGQTLGPVVTVLGELAQSITYALGQALSAVLPVAISAFQQLAPVITDVIGSVVPLIAELAGPLTSVLAELVTTLLPVVSRLISQLVPVFVAVLSAILPLVSMLISQLVPVFTQIITTLLPPLMRLFEALVPVVMALLNALMPIITTLVSALAPILITLVQALLPPLAQVLGMVANVLSTIVLPILTVVINVLGVVLTGVIQALMPIVQTVFGFIAGTIGNVMTFVSGIINTIMAIIRGDWDGAWAGIQMALGAIWEQIKLVVMTAINLVWNIITGVMTLIATGWNAIWEVIKAIGLAVWTWIVNTASALFNTLKAGIEFIFNGVRDFFSLVWTTIRDTVLNTINDFIAKGRAAFDGFKTGVETIFTNLRDGIGIIWNGIQDIVKAPIRFVIDTVINKGLIDGINWVLDKLGMKDKQIGHIQLPPGFASGGYTGPGSKMQPAGIVHADEFVISKASRRRFERTNPGALDYINRTGALPGFFLGGHVPVPGGRVTNQHRIPYAGTNARWAGDLAMPAGTPIFAWKPGTVSSTIRQGTSYGWHVRVNHGDGTQSLYAHMSQIAVAAGQIVAAGQRLGAVGSTGNSSGPHLHFEIRGGNSPITGDTGSGDGGGGGIFAAAMGLITDRVSKPVEDWLDKIPGAELPVSIAKGAGKMVLDSAVDWVKALVPGDDGSMTGDTGPAGPTVNFGGHRFDATTAAMLNRAQQLLGRALVITQGSFSTRVRASGSTHAGAGAVDIGAPLTGATVDALRRAGFAAWMREPNQGPWARHIHAVANVPGASAAARAQYASFLRGGNGLGSYAAGGYTGPGARNRLAGLVHADEFVIRKSARQRIERSNPGSLEYMNRTGNMPQGNQYVYSPILPEGTDPKREFENYMFMLESDYNKSA